MYNRSLLIILIESEFLQLVFFFFWCRRKVVIHIFSPVCSGAVVTLECVEKLIKKDMLDPISGDKLADKDIIPLQRVR